MRHGYEPLKFGIGDGSVRTSVAWAKPSPYFAAQFRNRDIQELDNFRECGNQYFLAATYSLFLGMQRKAFTAILLSLCLWFGASCFAQATVELVADDMQLAGTLGDSTRIELQLHGDGLQPFFGSGGDSARTVEGVYYEHKTMQPIALKGQLFFASRRFILRHFEGDEETERFAGTWETKTGIVKGTWGSAASLQRLPFQLKIVGAGLKYADWLYRYASDLLVLWLRYPSAFHTIVQKMEYGSSGGEITAIKGKESAFWYLSKFRIEVERTLVRDGNTTRGYDVFQMLPGTKLLHYSEASFSKSDDRGIVSRCSAFVSVFQIQHAEWTDITPYQYKPLRQAIAAQSGCGATVLSDAIRIGDRNFYFSEGGSLKTGK